MSASVLRYSVFWKTDRALLREILARVRALQGQVEVLHTEGGELMALVDDIAADVADESTVIASVEQLLTNLSAQLAAALANGDLTKLQAIKDAIDTNKARLAVAVAAGTPGGPPAP